jgi:hypothetical protein
VQKAGFGPEFQSGFLRPASHSDIPRRAIGSKHSFPKAFAGLALIAHLLRAVPTSSMPSAGMHDGMHTSREHCHQCAVEANDDNESVSSNGSAWSAEERQDKYVEVCNRVEMWMDQTDGRLGGPVLLEGRHDGPQSSAHQYADAACYCNVQTMPQVSSMTCLKRCTSAL